MIRNLQIYLNFENIINWKSCWCWFVEIVSFDDKKYIPHSICASD